MKKLLIIPLLFIFVHSFGQTHKYYLSTALGNDNNTSAQAQSPSTPWKTVSRLNTFFASLVAGDSVLFNRGEIFPGEILATTKSGTAALPIVIAAYGSGAKPIITGFTSVTTWAS